MFGGGPAPHNGFAKIEDVILRTQEMQVINAKDDADQGDIDIYKLYGYLKQFENVANNVAQIYKNGDYLFIQFHEEIQKQRGDPASKKEQMQALLTVYNVYKFVQCALYGLSFFKLLNSLQDPEKLKDLNNYLKQNLYYQAWEFGSDQIVSGVDFKNKLLHIVPMFVVLMRGEQSKPLKQQKSLNVYQPVEGDMERIWLKRNVFNVVQNIVEYFMVISAGNGGNPSIRLDTVSTTASGGIEMVTFEICNYLTEKLMDKTARVAAVFDPIKGLVKQMFNYPLKEISDLAVCKNFSDAVLAKINGLDYF